ncbi:hypothetical protein WICPIJ_002155 [Wickerhamomyces pijperi]|uniref:Trafficking protein particle complex subunit n=1 Tax=Wickerhamomyces pijperi TaxID=599730 RepID=A0A9P8TQG3_WICPI|nr:hypothetical protein WICPIJ_002155 [Wickerhamomyces pijperi]
MSYYLAIIGTTDSPIYECEFGTHKQGGDGTSKFSPEMKELNPFILHSSIDIVEDIQWQTNSMFLKSFDEFHGPGTGSTSTNVNYYISGFLTSGNVKFLMIHDNSVYKNEDSIKQFFMDLNDLYVKTLLNPFYKVNDVISSSVFDLKVKACAKKYL